MVLRYMDIQLILMVAVLTAVAQLQVNEDRSISFRENLFDNSRIVGGKPARAEEFPWQLFVLTQKHGNLSGCGGSIISADWSMSAAHCFTDMKTEGGQGFVVTAVSILLCAGLTDLNAITKPDPDKQCKPFSVEDFENHLFIHQDYNIGANANNDITIIKNKEPWILSDKVAPISLANADDFMVGKELIASGWGRTCADCNSSSLLLYVTGLKLISRKQCTKIMGDQDGWKITDNMICHMTPDSNACKGDSGGPVITGSGDSNGPPYVQIGIVSWGNKSCDAFSPGVFADVAKYRNWINETIEAVWK